MKGPFSFFLLLLCFSQAVRSQEEVFCIQAITTTIAYVPALTLSNGACPSNNAARGIEYNKVSDLGCCTAGATAKTMPIGTGAACCPCGAFCTGYFPEVQAWSTQQNGELLVQVSTTVSGKPLAFLTKPTAIAA
ncbi:hypothetical protein EJ08DRAFT_335304 [Tothia fuscella]|uniref:Uncharacterized protein n=1 Tax=Tothia fuscella TaxID=1048955 RepID=A0A9P4P155_9PEZI|nr:hypothetical protein EJ08DRAFT_335304 [Tothia fuscella]